MTGSVDIGLREAVELYLVVEGERDGLPVYCTRSRIFRIDGRAIPARMVVTPEVAGLEAAEVHWQELRPTPDATDWTRRRLDDPQDPWVRDVLDFPDPDPDSGFPPSVGTARFAAAISLPAAGGAAPRVLGTDGWTRRSGWANPEDAPGFRVTRRSGMMLEGQAAGYARLPVLEGATRAHVREYVALAPNDLVLAAYGDLRGKPLDGPREKPLDDPAWAWLAEVLVDGVVRRPTAFTPWATPRGRGLRWGAAYEDETAVLAGDIVLLADGPIVLSADDGDGWLDNGDRALCVRDGTLAITDIENLPGARATVLRLRDFRMMRIDLARAGYGPLRGDWFFGTDLESALAEFQRDRGMEATGRPDEATRDALATFLERMGAAGDDAGAPAASGTPLR